MSNEDFAARDIRRHERPAMGKLYDTAMDWLLDAARESAAGCMGTAARSADDYCESEIEKLFAVAWAAALHRGVIELQWGGWAVQYEFVTPDEHQASVFSRVINDPHVHLAPDPKNDIGMSRHDYIFPQFKFDQYRADFVLVRWEADYEFGYDGHRNITSFRRKTTRLPLVVVECDGHDYHEKTKEQAQCDKARDRYFAAAGFHVLRFTGSELHRDAMKCAAEVADFFEQASHPQGQKGRRV